jgi:hypothetical protein
VLVRSTCNHYHNTYRKEGEEFEHSGPLYEHIEPVNPPSTPPSQPGKKRTKATEQQAEE